MTMPVMVYDGTKWVSPGGGTPSANQVDDYSAGTYTITPPTGARFLWYELIGAGGGMPTSTTGGGGGGSYRDRLVAVDDLPASPTLVVGAGAYGAAGNSTTFNGMTAPGGQPGSGASGGAGGDGAPGGTSGQSGQSGPVGSGGGGGGNGGHGGNSGYGAGGGAGGGSGTSAGTGGQKAVAEGRLKAANGSGADTSGIAPGGGAGGRYNYNIQRPGGDGAARLTWIF